MLKLFSKNTSALTKRNILDILKLKDMNWKYGLKKQEKFFSENIRKKDIHNLLYNSSILVGYTCLRKKKYCDKNLKFNFFHFDTLIINKKFRYLGLGRKLMKFNNKIIKEKKSCGILICKKKMLKFYEKYQWKSSGNKFKNKFIMFYCTKLGKKILIKKTFANDTNFFQNIF